MMAKAVRKEPGRPRDAAAHRAILKAALALFIESGVEGASIDQIAERAGVARTTIYRRWSSKEALLAEAVGTVRESAEQALPNWRGMPLKTLLELLARTGPDLVTEPNARKLIARLIGSVPNNPELMAAYWSAQLEPRRRLFGDMLERGQKEGQIAKDIEPAILQDIIAGAVMYRLLVHPGPHARAEMQSYFQKLLSQLGLVGGDPTSAKAGRVAKRPAR